MGLVIASGIAVGTLFTLFVVPAFYLLIGADHHKKTTAEEPNPNLVLGHSATT